MDRNLKRQMSLGVLLSYVSIAVKLVTGLLYTPILLHSLGKSQYGVYSLCTSFVGYLTILNAGVNAAYIRFYVQEKALHKDNVEKLNGLFCKIFIVLSTIGFVGGLCVSYFSPFIFGLKITPNEYELVRKCFILLAFTIAIEIFTCVFRSFIMANEEFIFSKIIDILTALLYPVMAIPLLHRGEDCTAVITVRFIVAVITLLFDYIFCRKKLDIRFLFKKSESVMLKNISQFIAFIALQSIMDQLNWQIDKFILARIQGTSEISIYSVGSTFNSYFLLIGGAVSGVFIAEINRLVAANDEVRLNDLFRRTCKLFTYLIGFIITAFVTFGRPFILRWAGEDYSRSFTVGWMLMVPVTFSMIMGLGQDIARAKNRHQIQIIINICICIVNMLVSIPLADYYGSVGSAFGTFMAEIIVCMIVQPLYYSRMLGINMKNVFSDIVRYLPGLAIPAFLGFLLNYLDIVKSDYSSILLFGVVFTAIYFISIWICSMNSNDRQYVREIFRKKRL